MSAAPRKSGASPPAALVYASVETPIGRVWMARSERGIIRISLRSRGERAFLAALRADDAPATLVRDERALREAATELTRYFAGSLRRFTLAVDLRRVTPFQRRVLEATARVPFGRVVSYGEIARAIGKPGASRAVGNALGANPVPIVIPCHRVVAGDGSLGGFTGGTGLKRDLLRVEGLAL